MPINRSQTVVAAMLLAALLAASFAWWFRFSQTHAAAEFWGPTTSPLIAKAAQVQLLVLSPVGDSLAAETLADGGQSYRIERRIDISRAKGLIHARMSLLRDGHLDFSPNSEVPHWGRALEFRDGDNAVTLLFDLDLGRAKQLGAPNTVGVGLIREGLVKYFGELEEK